MTGMEDSFELALKLVGLHNEEKHYEDTQELEDLLHKKYGIEDTDGFDRLMNDLLPLIMMSKSELSGKIYQGFADPENQVYLMKREVL